MIIQQQQYFKLLNIASLFSFAVANTNTTCVAIGASLLAIKAVLSNK